MHREFRRLADAVELALPERLELAQAIPAELVAMRPGESRVRLRGGARLAAGVRSRQVFQEHRGRPAVENQMVESEADQVAPASESVRQPPAKRAHRQIEPPGERAQQPVTDERL